MGVSSVLVVSCAAAYLCLTANCILSGGRGYRPPGQLHVAQPADAEDGEEVMGFQIIFLMQQEKP